MMLQPRWRYSTSLGLKRWYGNVDYYGAHVIGQWFVLDAESGRECWSRRFRRPNTVRGVTSGVIVASEMRSDGPWTVDFGIYGIDVESGELLWTNHAGAPWGGLCAWLDLVPGFTNELRDAPEAIVDGRVLTRRGRVLDVRTGRPAHGERIEIESRDTDPAERLYHDKRLELPDGDVLSVEGYRDAFRLSLSSPGGVERWAFDAGAHDAYVTGDYYSYRLLGDRILVLMGDASECVPVDPGKPMIVQRNPASYRLGMVDVRTGAFESHPLEHASHRTQCRIEAVRGSRLLIGCDDTLLTEYELLPNPTPGCHPQPPGLN